jgi:hypothetical protein
MCEQRERLIGYVYNEGDPDELREVQQHVEACADCRHEIAALRSVREDLLAWDVPPTESVWRAFAPAPAPAPVWWKQVPAWGLAAAASVMLMAGMGGGALASGFSGAASGAPVAGNLVATPTGGAAVTPTADDLRALEERIGAAIRTQIADIGTRLDNAQVQLASNAASPIRSADNHESLIAELVELREQNRQLLNLVNIWNANWDSIRNSVEFKNGELSAKVRNLEQSLAQIVQASVK